MKLKNKIGVMQGRLLPKHQGRYQAHPVGYWQDEFKVAKEVGLDCIEFILDYNDAEKNPLLRDGGVEEIRSLTNNTGVSINTICADYFMEAPVHSEDESIANQSMEVLQRLIDNSLSLGVTDIVIPCVDQSTLADKAAVDRFVDKIRSILPVIEANGINLSLETDLAPQPFVELLDRLGSSRVTVNYDIGNSAALGFNPIDELDAYGSQISDIHIKDRTLGGGPVTLGEGDANFELFFNKLRDFDYQGPFIMQAYRDEEGVEIFKKQLAWIMPYLKQLHD